MDGKLNSARIISEIDADMYMTFSISYNTCRNCDYIIFWNAVSAFSFPAYYLISHLFHFALMHVGIMWIVLKI